MVDPRNHSCAEIYMFWLLSFESSMQTDLEEAKAQEIAKLQHSLQELQAKADETNSLLVKEREAVKKAVEEEPAVIQETQVLVEDTKKIGDLTAEVESLKVVMNFLII